MDLSQYNWPEVTVIDMAFPTFKTPPELLEEALRLGFDKKSNPYNAMFNTLFFTGLTNVEPLDGLPKDTKELAEFEGWQGKAWRWVFCFMKSWEPKHQHKEAVSAYIFSHLFKPEFQ